MRLKDTVHFNWYKNLFVIFIIFICLMGSVKITNADFYEAFTNLDQMMAFLSRMMHPDFAYLPKLVEPIIKTLQMSILGTAFGVALAVPFAFLATKVATKNGILTTIVRFFLNVVRTIPNLLLAAILVSIIGIGEGTGVLTIAIFTFGMVSQLLYEAIETIDLSPIEAMEAVGANKFQVAVYAIFPQILNAIVSYTFYALEINIRASTVLGYVGAGGIGIILNSSLALFRYDRVSIVILLIFAVVLVVDGISNAIRRRIA